MQTQKKIPFSNKNKHNRHKIKYLITSSQKSHICNGEEKEENNKKIKIDEEKKGIKKQEFIKSLAF